MQTIATELQDIISKYVPALQAVTEDKMSYKPLPYKWSKKEILGHLVDSAQNNIRRFIVAQYEDKPAIVYNQDKWVAISHYQHYPTADIIALWQLLNKHIAVILKNISLDASARECQTGDLHTIRWLAEDYMKHLRHHVHQILELEPVAYP